MLFEELLNADESRTLEFKENTNSPLKIAKTVVAFANTAGGTVVIGVEDKTKRLVGLDNILQEEEKVTNFLHDTIAPMILPEIDILNHQGKELLLIKVPHTPGPFYLKKYGREQGIYIRLGSSNRLADPESIANLQRVAKGVSFDEMKCSRATLKDLDEPLIHDQLSTKFKHITQENYQSLGIILSSNKKITPTYGGILLFGKAPTQWLPDAMIKCASFLGEDKKNILDKAEIRCNLIQAVDDIMLFVKRNMRTSARIGSIKRIDIPQYPIHAIREAITNALAHTDYSMRGTSIQIFMYTNRIEIISPGGLPFGQTINAALSGISKMRNPIIGRIFRELGIIETLGIGLMSIINAYDDIAAPSPLFEEVDHFFKVTLFSNKSLQPHEATWFSSLEKMLLVNKEISTKDAAIFWEVSDRTARSRLNKLVEFGYLVRDAQSKNDPQTTYHLKQLI
ncbi:MAG: hypothetical protein DHS20C10_05980 [marine bacterium B5-7]|nr:MAG: hypothetical protein DHS20C10_05980 [marine bacterium B5-7]